MKAVYLLATLMLVGIFLIFICSAKVLNDLSTTGISRLQDPTVQPSVQPRTQAYVIGTYLGLTFFAVGAVGSIFALFQAMRR